MGKISWEKNGKIYAKFTRMFNEYGMGEDLLFPIRINDSPTGTLETNLGSYLVKVHEFRTTQVQIRVEVNKDG